MVTICCTKKLRDFLGTTLTEPLLPSTSTLGDWYANWIPTYAGDLILIVNEKTLLAVAIPVWEAENLEGLFRMRVYNLLRLIGIDARIASKELIHYDQVQYAKTASRSVLGSMNELTYAIQYWSDPEYGELNPSISDLEVRLSKEICFPLEHTVPQDEARVLLGQG